MKASRLAVPPGQSARWTNSSVETSTGRSKSSNTSSKRKSCGPSTSRPRNKCPPPLYTTSPATEGVHDAATSSNVYPYPSGYEQATNLSNLPDCQWPNWPDWGIENRNERGDAVGPIGAPNYSDTSSSCSYSDSDCDHRWSTSSASSSSSRAHEPREMQKTSSFWEEVVWGERRSWKRLRHKKSFLTCLWDFKPETKVEENTDPILVSVNVLGSPGPLRLVVNRNDSVQHTVDFALRRYAAQKRQPALVDPTPNFGLYCRNPDFQALDDEERIGHRRNRQFHLYHKQRKDLIMEDIVIDDASSSKKHGTTGLASIKTWIWNNFNRMQSWAGNMLAGISRTFTFWVKYLKPRRFYRMYIASLVM